VKAKKTKAIDGKLGPHQVGDVVVIRAIPYHYIGEVAVIGEHCVTLAPGAVWLADSSRWASDFLVSGKVNEAEPFIDGVTVSYSVIGDVTKWRHAIPGQV